MKPLIASAIGDKAVMKSLEIIGNKVIAVAALIAKFKEPETEYPAPKPNSTPIKAPMTVLSPQTPIRFCNASASNGLFIIGIKSSNLLSGCKMTANKVIKCGTVTPGMPVKSSICRCHISPAFSSKTI